MIDLLTDRLRWPAALVRERAASQLGKLISEGDQTAASALVSWISDQNLESLAAVGVLPFLYASERNSLDQDTIDSIVSACEAKSPLSDIYISHLSSAYKSIPEPGRHSGAPPIGWQAPTNLSESPASSFERLLLRRLISLAENDQSTWVRQYDYEKFVLQEANGESPWQAFQEAGSRDHGYHPWWRPLSNEVSTSAYLRTLSWALSQRLAPNYLVLAAAAAISPIDLGLWKVQPAAPPSWWIDLGSFSQNQGKIEPETGVILKQIEGAADAWGTGPDVVLAASGCVSHTNLRHYDLEVRSFFQRTEGPNRPTSQELVDALCALDASDVNQVSPIRFEGLVTSSPGARRFEDWIVIPGSVPVNPISTFIWQGWRGIRGIQCPFPLIVESGIKATCTSESLNYETEEGHVATWSDWTRGMSALAVADLKPASGWVLTAPKAVIDQFSKENGMTLAWAWQVTIRFRVHRFEDFLEMRMYGDKGANLVLRP